MRVIIGVVFAAILLAAPAHADDDTYLQDLKNNQITWNNDRGIIAYGKAVCVELGQSVSFIDIVTGITKDYPTLPRKGADGLAAAAIRAFCPGFTSQVISERLDQPRVNP